MSTLQVTRLDSGASGFDAALDALTRWSAVADPALEQQVGSIIADVRQRGDTALLEYTARFDHFETSVSGLSLFAADVQASIERVDGDVIDALRLAASRIRAFHERQKAESWQFTDASGTLLGQQVTPLDNQIHYKYHYCWQEFADSILIYPSQKNEEPYKSFLRRFTVFLNLVCQSVSASMSL